MTIFQRPLILALGWPAAGLVLFPAMPALAVCDGLPDHQALRSALAKSVEAAGALTNDQVTIRMLATVVGADGTVCSVEMLVAPGGEPAASGRIRKDPPLSAIQLQTLRLRALKQGF